MSMTDFQAALGLSQLRGARDQGAPRDGRGPVLGRFRRAGRPCRAARGGGGRARRLAPVPAAPGRAARGRRDQLIEDLDRPSIGSSVHYKPLHLISYVKERLGFHGGEYPVCEDSSARVLSLPLVPGDVGGGRRPRDQRGVEPGRQALRGERTLPPAGTLTRSFWGFRASGRPRPRLRLSLSKPCLRPRGRTQASPRRP